MLGAVAVVAAVANNNNNNKYDDRLIHQLGEKRIRVFLRIEAHM